jgi:hypothetical protein
VEGLFDEEGERWSAASEDLASTIIQPQTNWDGLGWDFIFKKYFTFIYPGRPVENMFDLAKIKQSSATQTELNME